MIQPTYQSDRVTLYRADCLEVLPQLAAGYYLVIDPPYGIGESGKQSRANLAAAPDYGAFSWDKQRVPEHIKYAIAPAAEAVIFGGNYYTDILPASMGWIVWDKLNGGNDFADCEMAWTSYKRAARMFRYLWNGMIKAKPEERFHPTQKPLAPMDWVIANYTPPDCVVLDCFMGAGTTGAAVVRMGQGRRFIGVELDPGYYAIAEKRIRAAEAQLLLGI